MELWQTHRRWVRVLRGLWGSLVPMVPVGVLIAGLTESLPALAQDDIVATATLPRDLSPWGMYLNADPVVKAVRPRTTTLAPSPTPRDRGGWSPQLDDVTL